MTPAFAAYIAAARRRPELWRLVVGLAVVVIVYMGGLILIGGIVRVTAPPERFRETMDAFALADRPGAMLGLLASFGFLVLGTVTAAWLLQRRGPGTLLGRAPVVIRHFTAAAATVLLVYGIAMIPWAGAFDAVPNLPLATWAMLLPLSLLGVAVQTLAEEITFRGYLMQQLAARFPVWLALLLPAVAFAALHFDPANTGGNTWLVLAAITVFALAAGDLTRRTGSLGAAWGLHFANNCIALLLIATGAPLSGLALWRTGYAASDPVMVWSVGADIAAIVVTWAVLARRLGR